MRNLQKNTISVGCSRKNLKHIRHFVDGHLLDFKVDDINRNLIVLAIDEICANKIIHAHKENEGDSISLTINIQQAPTGLIFDIIDTGEAFDPLKYKRTNLKTLIKEKRKGSLGMVIVSKVMDEVTFRTENSQNICRLVKFINQPERA